MENRPLVLVDVENNVFCPHCHKTGTIREIDRAERWNDAEFHVVDGNIARIRFVMDRDFSWETDRYECRECGGSVSLPQVETSWVD